MGETFFRARLSYLAWLSSLKKQLIILRLYPDIEYRVLYSMRRKLYKLGIKYYKESQYVRKYRGGREISQNDNKKIKEEANQILGLLYNKEDKYDKEYERYLRGSKEYRETMEKKWLI